MATAVWLTVIVVAAAIALYPRIVESQQRARFPLGPTGVIVGAESIDLAREGAPGVLVLHGGGDTPQSMRGLAEFLNARGYSVRVPLMETHGRALEAMAHCDAEGWRAQARAEFEALRATHSWVALVGQSVGGALALDLAATVPDVKVIALLAPWIAMPQALRTIAKSSRVWEWLIPYLPSLGGHSIHDPQALSRVLTRGIVTPSQLRALADVERFAQAALPRVHAPTLTVQSREDERIAADAAQRAFEKLGSTDKRFEWTTGAGHVISVDYGKERVFELVGDWLDAHRNR